MKLLVGHITSQRIEIDAIFYRENSWAYYSTAVLLLPELIPMLLIFFNDGGLPMLLSLPTSSLFSEFDNIAAARVPRNFSTMLMMRLSFL